MNQRLTRKDMKRDEFTAVVGRSVEYAETHVRTLVYAVGGLLLVIALAVGFYYYRNGQQQKANQALADAMKVYHAQVTATGAKPDDPDEPSFPTDAARRARAKELLTRVHQSYGSTDAGDVAGLYLAQIAADEGRFDEARKLWNDYADDHKGTMLGGEARLNLLSLDRKQGKGEAVVKELRSMLEKGDSPLPQDLILHQLGITLEDLHRPQEAIQAYQRIIDEFPQSTFRTDAQQKISALDPTRAPAGGAGLPGGLPPGFPG
ncbi:MAG TPA: tetratricopeptide repeat protein [Thermoanaerobaculia bacterium]